MAFVFSASGVTFTYIASRPEPFWVWRRLKDEGAVRLSKTFNFLRSDLIEEPDEAILEDENQGSYAFVFRFATLRAGYYEIEGRIFEIENPIFIAEDGPRVERRLFVAYRDISIFRKIAELIPPGQPIVVGGDRDDAIPQGVFEELIHKFPGTTEFDRYAEARIATIIGDHLEPLKDYQGRYEAYVKRRMTRLVDVQVGEPALALLQSEIEKYQFIRDTLIDWLQGPDRLEGDWQKLILRFLLLIFPKYVAVLSNVRLPDAYSTPGSVRNRFIDLALIDAGGTIDVIEIKTPSKALLSRAPYRDNSVPSRELAGSIMQAEKYLFHLTKWGRAGEAALTNKYGPRLPSNLDIRITNPRGLIIVGRDRAPDGTAALSPVQQLDFEIIKRKYARMMDVLTYDDLLRRLESIIASLTRRASGAGTFADLTGVIEGD